MITALITLAHSLSGIASFIALTFLSLVGIILLLCLLDGTHGSDDSLNQANHDPRRKRL